MSRGGLAGPIVRAGRPIDRFASGQPNGGVCVLRGGPLLRRGDSLGAGKPVGQLRLHERAPARGAAALCRRAAPEQRRAAESGGGRLCPRGRA